MTRLRIFLSRLWSLVRSRSMDREIHHDITATLPKRQMSTSSRAFPRRRRAGLPCVVSVA